MVMCCYVLMFCSGMGIVGSVSAMSAAPEDENIRLPKIVLRVSITLEVLAIAARIAIAAF